MRPGLKSSIALHTCIFLLIFLGLPVFTAKRSYEDQVITVEVLPVSALTNVKPKQAKPKTNPIKKEVITKEAPKISVQEKKLQEQVKTEPLPAPVIKKEEKKETIKPEEPEKIKPKQEKKKQETKKEDKPKVSDDAFASVLKSVEEFRETEQDKKENKEEEKVDFSQVQDFLSNAKESQYKEGVPLSLSEKDAIRQQIMKNWTVPAGAKDIQNTIVVLKINVQPDGTISKVEIKDQSRYNSDNFFRAIADSATRAVYKSSPLQNLPPDKYDVKDGWQELEINFDPRDMVY